MGLTSIVKRRDLLKELQKVAKAKGETFIITEGGNHSKVQIGSWSEPIPKHREIAENLARAIIRRSQQ